MDEDQDGYVSAEEYHKAIQDIQGGEDISLDEVPLVLPEALSLQVNDFFHDFADVNGDGHLSYEELESLDI
jgi:Ca2+-binding EF-hand superfamily protein